MDIWRFNTQGINYSKYRPEYPSALCGQALLPLSKKQKYLDIAVGTGKVLLSFCENFKETKGIDISQQMLGVAQSNVNQFVQAHPINTVSLQKNDVMNLSNDQKFDLITCGQALHFFPVEEALRKIKGMLNEGGMFMTFGYVLRDVKSQNPNQNSLFYEFYDQMLPYFTFDMYDLHKHYTESQKYPFEEVFDKVDRKQYDLVVEWTRDEYIHYLKTWSAYNIYQAKFGVDPIQKLQQNCAEKVTCVFDYFRVRCFK